MNIQLHLPLFALIAFAPCGSYAQPYDFTAADTLLQSELNNLEGHVAVIVRQNGTPLYRFQAGDIDYGTKTRLASVSKTISAGVILALVDDNVLSLDERLGDTLETFEINGLGDPTILDAWGMRHGIDSLIAYEHDQRFDLAASVERIGRFGYLEFEPGTRLGYDGSAMQAVGRIAEIKTDEKWEEIASSRIFDRCDMPEADYEQFDPNPAVAGGLRSTAEEIITYAQMIIDRGLCNNVERVLSETAIERLFTNATRDLPVHYSPWPAEDPLYPYGEDPDYAFGVWILAENPESGHVEEIVGAGAWGSYVWIDRRRGLTAVLITDVRPGSQRSSGAALGLFDIARQQIDAAQVGELAAGLASNGQARLTWTPAQGAIASRVYGADEPILDRFVLDEATLLAETDGTEAVVPNRPYYAVTAVFDALENTALTPDANTIAHENGTCPADLDGNGKVDGRDLMELIAQWGDTGSADLDGDGQIGFTDVRILLANLGTCP